MLLGAPLARGEWKSQFSARGRKLGYSPVARDVKRERERERTARRGRESELPLRAPIMAGYYLRVAAAVSANLSPAFIFPLVLNNTRGVYVQFSIRRSVNAEEEGQLSGL